MDDASTRKDIGARLKRARKARTQSQREFAAETGMPLPSYRDYEGGKRVPGGDALRRFARAGIDAHWLLTGEQAAAGGRAHGVRDERGAYRPASAGRGAAAAGLRAPFYPIVYLRGYAATLSEIEAAAADPYMGFNLGSTKLRQDAGKKPVKFIFESPVLRLIKDHGYVDAFRHGGADYDPGAAPARSIWVFRYYERVSESLGEGRRAPMEEFAVRLRRFILEVRDAICGDDPEARDAFKVHLVAHSMGGLLCRSYLQNICRHGAPDPADNPALELTAGGAGRHYVDKVFTYGTPHNGIDFTDVNVPDPGGLDLLQLGNFNRGRMREYLRADTPNDLDGAFPPERFFCFIGSNYRDYGAFWGLSRHVTGAASDGLVMMANAWVKDAPRAVAHRSHSGPYGIVNSESGYQNLRRFLFGDLRVTATLRVGDLPLPDSIQEKKDAGHAIRGAYHFDAACRVRGAATYLLHERRYDQEAAIVKTYDELTKEHKPVYLFTGYLLEQARQANDTALEFAIDLAVRVPAFEVDRRFWFDEHVEGFLYQDTLSFAVRPGTIRYGFASKHGLGETPKQAEIVDAGNGARELSFPVETPARMRPGLRATLVLRVEPWS